jgi:hypothetical protein
MLAAAGSGCEGEFGPGAGGVAGPCIGPGGPDQDDGVVEGAAPGVVFAAGVVVLLAAVFLSGAAELAEGD